MIDWTCASFVSFFFVRVILANPERSDGIHPRRAPRRYVARSHRYDHKQRRDASEGCRIRRVHMKQKRFTDDQFLTSRIAVSMTCCRSFAGGWVVSENVTIM